MRKLLFLVLLISFSCSDEVKTQDDEILRNEILASAEFKEMKSSYKNYSNFKLDEIQSILHDKKSGRLSQRAFLERKEAYVNQMADMMIVVIEKQSELQLKYPNTKELFDDRELLNIIIEGNDGNFK